MPRLFIELSSQQHKRIKANAAPDGKPREAFILEQALGEGREIEALEQLRAVLKSALEQACNGEFSKRSVQDIIRDGKLS